MKIKTKTPAGEDKVVDAEVVPFRSEQETFNVYFPNVGPDHALYGKTIKVKLVVKSIYYVGLDDLGNPQAQVMWEPIVGIE